LPQVTDYSIRFNGGPAFFCHYPRRKSRPLLWTARRSFCKTLCWTRWWATGKWTAPFEVTLSSSRWKRSGYFNHQFLQVHEKGAPDAKTAGPAYEATVMIGYDHTSERYVVHWMDIYGGRFSETLGYGVRSGDQIEIVFEYPDGPFHTTFHWLPEKKQWQWLMKTKDNFGHWVEFANLALTREPAH
jgi:hypothetical protein